MDSPNLVFVPLVFFIMYLIRYLFTGSIWTKYEDEPDSYKLATTIIATALFSVILLGTILDFFNFYEFSFRWFIVITFVVGVLSKIYFDLKYMKHTKEYLITLCQSVFIVPALYLIFY
ncbi:hypothetical protein ACLIA0_15090 [Bacillaceae bacterium W0354]